MKICSAILFVSAFAVQTWNGAAFAPVAKPVAFLGQTRKNASGPLYSSYMDSLGRGLGDENAAVSKERRQALEAISPAWISASVPQNEKIQLKSADQIWEEGSPVIIQGNSLRTCSLDQPVDRMEVLLKSEGRPLNANIELWQGPDNTPAKMKVYIEDGKMRPFRAIFETPGGGNSIAVLNTGNLEFPLAACIAPHQAGNSPGENLASIKKAKTVQGGAVNTTPVTADISSVQVLIQSDGRPVNARIELLQGPNNNKQVIDLYLEDGCLRPFFIIIETPGAGNVVRIVNKSTMEYPLSAIVEPFLVKPKESGAQGMSWSD